jgi:hypothetical protein
MISFTLKMDRHAKTVIKFPENQTIRNLATHIMKTVRTTDGYFYDGQDVQTASSIPDFLTFFEEETDLAIDPETTLAEIEYERPQLELRAVCFSQEELNKQGLMGLTGNERNWNPAAITAMYSQWLNSVAAQTVDFSH